MAKQKHHHVDAWPVALAVAKSMAPHCERIAIVGSLRRKKTYVGDIELLYVPKYEARQPLMFEERWNEKDDNLANRCIDEMCRAGVIKARFNVSGHHTWGPQNKLALHIESGIPLDLFATTEENWLTSLVIRTGGKDSNIALCTGAQHLGRKLNAYGCGVTMPDGSVVQPTSEAHLFELCGCEYKEPEQRL